MRQKLDTSEIEIARIAGLQHGVITRKQLISIGVTPSGVSRRVRKGWLHRLHQGIYAVGHLAPSQERDWMAAVLACGEGAALSHGSAAALWRLLRPIDGPVDVSVPSRGGRAKRRGIRLHRCSSLLAIRYDDVRGRGETLVTVRNRIPVTTVSRTIEDLRGAVPTHLVRRATRQAELAGYRIDGVEGRRTRSGLEDDFLDFCSRHGVPRPEVNVKIGGFEVDFVWRAERVAVETDDFRYHRGSVAYDDDHARELELRRHGFAVRRYVGRQLEEEPERVVADLLDVLTQGSEETSGAPRR